MATTARWKREGFFLLEAVEYRPESGRARVRYRNQDVGEALVEALWRNRPGRPDWGKVRIDPQTHGALLVPTHPGHPTTEGDVAEIPGDVLRAATDVDYRAYLANRLARRAKEIGQRLAQIREARGLTQKTLALSAGVEEWLVAGIESGRLEASLTTMGQLLTAMGASLQDLRGLRVN
jgi:DNA-binding XRE family transcriptional regulator